MYFGEAFFKLLGTLGGAQCLLGPDAVLLDVVGLKRSVGQTGVSQREARILLQCFLVIIDGRADGLVAVGSAVGLASAQIQVVSVCIVGGSRRRAGQFFIGHLDVERGNQLPRELVFDGQNVLGRTGELLAPQFLAAVGRVQEVHDDRHLVFVALQDAFDDQVRARTAGNFCHRVFIREFGCDRLRGELHVLDLEQFRRKRFL